MNNSALNFILELINNSVLILILLDSVLEGFNLQKDHAAAPPHYLPVKETNGKQLFIFKVGFSFCYEVFRQSAEK